MSAYVDPDKAQFQAFVASPCKGPVQMLNLIKLRAEAAYGDGHTASGAEAYRRYGKEAEPVFRRLGGRQIWRGQFELMVIGPGDERWDFAFIAEYPNSDAFIEMVRDPAYQLAVRHRQAAVADSRLIRFQPQGSGAGFSDP